MINSIIIFFSCCVPLALTSQFVLVVLGLSCLTTHTWTQHLNSASPKTWSSASGTGVQIAAVRRQSFLKKEKKIVSPSTQGRFRGVLCLCFDARERRFSEAMLKDMFGFFFLNNCSRNCCCLCLDHVYHFYLQCAEAHESAKHYSVLTTLTTSWMPCPSGVTSVFFFFFLSHSLSVCSCLPHHVIAPFLASRLQLVILCACVGPHLSEGLGVTRLHAASLYQPLSCLLTALQAPNAARGAG